MKSQTPAEGILINREYGDAKHYTLTCECCNTDCTHNVWIEAEDTGVTVTTYTQQKTQWWNQSRWKTIWALLTRGYVEYEASIIMTQQQALNYAQVLQSAVKDVEQFRKQRTQSKSTQNQTAVRLAEQQDCV
jgi:hypothetical protein